MDETFKHSMTFNWQLIVFLVKFHFEDQTLKIVSKYDIAQEFGKINGLKLGTNQWSLL